ncbi:MAG: hypothetical protein GC204_05005 [Chloroflexi bacterium]|nr:hypothetical protein [Chloroflexota bacterium]
MNGFYLLASYPKSGNTWVRAFLRNYWLNTDEPSDINEVGIPIINMRYAFDETFHIDSGDLMSEEIDMLRPTLYREIAKTASESKTTFKVHDALQHFENGEPFFPIDVILGVIYVIRNPLDVAVSYAHHNHWSIDEMIEAMADENYGLSHIPMGQSLQLPQRLFSWSSHVRSWVDATDFPIFIVRYEDMIFNPLETFSSVIQFLGEALNVERVKKAIRFSSFGELKKQEEKHGFKETPPDAQMFFRKGIAGEGRNVLTPEQIQRLVNNHYEMMHRFRYLADDDEALLHAQFQNNSRN